MTNEPSHKKHLLFTKENGFVFVVALFALALAMAADRRGMPQKWHAAILGTVVPFAMCIYGVRVAWRRWSFWLALAVCLLAHMVTLWIFFQYVLLNVSSFGTLYWFPVAFAEGFVLLIAVKRVEEKLTGKPEYYKLN